MHISSFISTDNFKPLAISKKLENQAGKPVPKVQAEVKNKDQTESFAVILEKAKNRK